MTENCRSNRNQTNSYTYDKSSRKTWSGKLLRKWYMWGWAKKTFLLFFILFCNFRAAWCCHNHFLRRLCVTSTSFNSCFASTPTSWVQPLHFCSSQFAALQWLSWNDVILGQQRRVRRDKKQTKRLGCDLFLINQPMRQCVAVNCNHPSFSSSMLLLLPHLYFYTFRCSCVVHRVVFKLKNTSQLCNICGIKDLSFYASWFILRMYFVHKSVTDLESFGALYALCCWVTQKILSRGITDSQASRQ